MDSKLLVSCELDDESQRRIIDMADNFIAAIRRDTNFSIESFMQQFSLSTKEGVAIICLAEGLLRVRDGSTASKLAVSLLSDGKWFRYICKSRSLKAFFASSGLFLAGAFADLSGSIVNLIFRLGQVPFVFILSKAVCFLGKEFVLGASMRDATEVAKNLLEYKFSFDMLGESSRTQSEADKYYRLYQDALDEIQNHWPADVERPQLSVKLTALDPRVEWMKREDIELRLLPKLVALVRRAGDMGVSIAFDAEEARRLDIYIHVMRLLLLHKDLLDLSICLVIQAYQTRAYDTLDTVISIAKERGSPVMIRLVKGAYWDAEIKYAQENCLQSYPVFTCKDHTDVSYIACARKILANSEYLIPAFATHNALTVATIMTLAGDKKIEFQKLYGMGDALHKEIIKKGYAVRIYAPVGGMCDLLAYLMRRMLENGSSACFVNKVNDKSISIQDLSYNLRAKVETAVTNLPMPRDLYSNRSSAEGFHIGYAADYKLIFREVSKYLGQQRVSASIVNGQMKTSAAAEVYGRPAMLSDRRFSVHFADKKSIEEALNSASQSALVWGNVAVVERGRILDRIADLLEENKFEFYALLLEEAGKTITDAIAEVAEAVDFCRYYARQAQITISPLETSKSTSEQNILTWHPRGVFLCISPWNFPLAIFVGQIVAALVCGNAVIAKAADMTSVIASFAVRLMHDAGIPQSALHLVLATGYEISRYFVADERISGVAFTGSTATAKKINETISNNVGRRGLIPLIAETGGQNAMIVDSSALLEQVTDDAVLSAIGSAGQRCSALRIIYIQEEVYDSLVHMIIGAMQMLSVGDTVDFSTDVGPIINETSKIKLTKHIEDMTSRGFKVLANHHTQPDSGTFFAPHIVEVNKIKDISDERFGPILHVAKYNIRDLDKVIEEINGCGFGLTFGVHSRVESRINYITSKIKAGNTYVNRSMTGARVESQPFGGERNSGTGFKAGGPHYLYRFMTERTLTINLE